MVTYLSFHVQKKIFIIIIIDSWSLGGEEIHILIMNKPKQGMLYLWMMHLVNKDHLDQYLVQNILTITCIQVEEATSVKNQHPYMDQFINQNWCFCTLEDTLAGCHRHFLKDLSIVCHKKVAMILWLLIQLLIHLVPIK